MLENSLQVIYSLGTTKGFPKNSKNTINFPSTLLSKSCKHFTHIVLKCPQRLQNKGLLFPQVHMGKQPALPKSPCWTEPIIAACMLCCWSRPGWFGDRKIKGKTSILLQETRVQWGMNVNTDIDTDTSSMLMWRATEKVHKWPLRVPIYQCPIRAKSYCSDLQKKWRQEEAKRPAQSLKATLWQRWGKNPGPYVHRVHVMGNDRELGSGLSSTECPHLKRQVTKIPRGLY